MKLAVAVLSSILLACSVTIANPIDPSATTSTKSITSPTPNPNGIGLGGLDPLSDSVKDLLKEYIELEDDRNEQGKKCKLLQSEYDNQQKLIADLETKIYVLGGKSQRNGDNSKYDGEIQKTRLDLEAQKSKLADLGKSRQDCEFKCSGFVAGKSMIEIGLVNLIFGKSWNPRSFEQQFVFIATHSSVMSYLGELGSKGQSSGRSNNLGQNHGDQQQHQNHDDQQQRQDSQPLLDTPSESGSSVQRVSSNRRKDSSKLVRNVGSFFQKSRRDDPSN
ncbi:hypothetical protein O5D80_006341 [Batrachochytrium dendrobatidis]|nr:hypothetical protein O5D80_006341 [Batrachochytrium dendrobatidis]